MNCAYEDCKETTEITCESCGDPVCEAHSAVCCWQNMCANCYEVHKEDSTIWHHEAHATA